MRPDFNKQLTERERLGHDMKFHQVRGVKRNRFFDEDGVGGKVSIHYHRKQSVVDKKMFNENLNPLRSFIQRNVGRPWNKVFSEIAQSFDRRKVINQHIFEHLLEFVETNVRVVNGKPCTLSRFLIRRTANYEERWTPIEKTRVKWYVDPLNGILKANEVKSAKARRLEQQKKDEQEALRVFRVLDTNHNLFFVDGGWFIYTLSDLPIRCVQPYDMLFSDWVKLTQEERRKKGIMRFDYPVHSLDNPFPKIYKAVPPYGKYYSTRRTAGKKLLRQLGLSVA